MNAPSVYIPLACVAFTALIAAELVFKAVVKREKDKTDFILHLHAVGHWWMFLRDAIDGWPLSALGRGLVILGVSSGVAAVIVYVLTN